MHLLQFPFNRRRMLSTNIKHFIMYCKVLFFDRVSTLHSENKVRSTLPNKYRIEDGIFIFYFLTILMKNDNVLSYSCEKHITL